MCLSCKTKKVSAVILNRVTNNPIKFDAQQLQQLRKKFTKVSGHNLSINRQLFLKNMGILGLQSAQGFADRLFNSFDIDNDNKISFQDFAQYMQILKCGSQKSKSRISFKLIDYKNINKISIEDFKQFLDDFFRSWSSITNLPITSEIKNRTDQYVKVIFNKVFKIRGIGQIDFKFYSEYLYNKDRQFMEVFDFITHGVGDLFIAQNGLNRRGQNYQNMQKSAKLLTIMNKVQRLYNVVFQQENQDQLFFLNICQQEYPQEIPTFNPQISNIIQKRVIQEINMSRDVYKDHAKGSNTMNTTNLVDNSGSNGFQFSKNIYNMNNSHNNSHPKELQTSRLNIIKQLEAQGPCLNQQCKENRRKLDYLEKKISRMIFQFEDLKNQITIQMQKRQNNDSKFLKRGVNNVHVCHSQGLQQMIKMKQQQAKSNKVVNNIKQNRNRTTTATTNEMFSKRITEGNMVFFGDQNWNLVLNMMIGIQMAVRSVRGYAQMLYQQPKDFNLRYYFELVPRRFGDDDITSTIYSFTDYAPNTFNHIRRLFNIDNQDYIKSIGPNRLMASLMLGEMSSMTQLTSQGKSGSFFYYTADGKYMLKTIKEKQYRFFRSILKEYYYHLKKNTNTLITKFYGLHKLVQKNQKGNTIRKSYFVIMANVFNTKQKIIERFDIKGSWFGRQNHDPHPNATKKDNDFLKRQPLQISKKNRQEIISVIRSDAEFFQQHNIIDYSLLIGVINISNQLNQLGQFSEKSQRPFYGRVSSMMQRKNSQMSQKNEDPFARRDTHFVQGRNQLYLFGIIDILTEYDSRKVAQFYFKRAIYGEGISAVPPDDYAQRFVNFIQEKVFPSSRQQ